MADAIATSMALVPVLLAVLLIVASARQVDSEKPAQNSDRHVSVRQVAALKTFEYAIVRRDRVQAGLPSAEAILERFPQCRAAWGGRVSALRQVRQLLTWMQALSIVDASTGDHKGAPLLDLAYTLQVGREAMEERLALQVSSFTDLMEKLGRYVQDPQEAGDWYRGQARQYKDMIALWGSDEELQETINKWLQRGKYEKLLQGWVKGLTIDWMDLYGSEPRTHSTAPALPHRISLPTYPFAPERYWLPAPPIGDRSTAQSTVSTAPAITTHSRWDGLVFLLNRSC